ncbi:hypothetical protein PAPPERLAPAPP_03100 [Brevundimonas phage vB_BpoS-Papperlapapp]|uniref:Uncharacterized protein n=1 Tax=Brevundimonas phage vB_BpoS-Kabachok TaxID=2948600 RepID=A0A9E7MPY9_9CAUD|nr:hypothetical protein KABACHOK_01460 [Brevundimonas phage vB_BpoS-Kabachok]USN16051.1 hypothetical protein PAPPERLAPAPP_03100 [Brevundimonas phage vB_BpoS-Papperlapapp]
MHSTTYTIPGRDEAFEAFVQSPVLPPRRRQEHGKRQAIPSAAERAQRARLLLGQCVCA